MFEKKKKIELDGEELKIMRYSLNEFRNNLLEQNKYTDAIDEVMIKLKDKMKVDKYEMGVMINSLDKTLKDSQENSNTSNIRKLLLKLFEVYQNFQKRYTIYNRIEKAKKDV